MFSILEMPTALRTDFLAVADSLADDVAYAGDHAEPVTTWSNHHQLSRVDQ